METLKSVLDEITAIQGATSEKSYDELWSLLNPMPDKKEMGKTFEKTIGWNPITHYDEADINLAIDEYENAYLKNYPGACKVVEKNRSQIVTTTMDYLEAAKKDNIKEAIAGMMKDILSSNSESDIPTDKLYGVLDSTDSKQSSGASSKSIVDEDYDDDDEGSENPKIGKAFGDLDFEDDKYTPGKFEIDEFDN